MNNPRLARRVPDFGYEGLEAANVGHAHVAKHVYGMVLEGEANSVHEHLDVGNVGEVDDHVLGRGEHIYIYIHSEAVGLFTANWDASSKRELHNKCTHKQERRRVASATYRGLVAEEVEFSDAEAHAVGREIQLAFFVLWALNRVEHCMGWSGKSICAALL